MKRLTSISVLVFLIVAAAPTVGSEHPSGKRPVREYSAAAFTLDGEELLYVERHVESWRGDRLVERTVTYEDAAGRLIARKRVEYGDDSAQPSFEMNDLRTGLRESARVANGSVELFSGEPTDDSGAVRVTLPESAVIDAGFDAFVRQKFPRIARGERLDFEFAVPAMGRFFRFQLRPQGEIAYGRQPAIAVRMVPASRLLRLLLDPIDLVYDRDGRLLEFRGLSNVTDEEGDRYKARIVFDYPDETPSTKMARVGPGGAAVESKGGR